MERSVWWCSLKERAIYGEAVDALELVAMHAGAAGYHKLRLPYLRVDAARNQYAQGFRNYAKSPDDVVVMLDDDHGHPPDILERLVTHITPKDDEAPVGVVGAMAYQRGVPFLPCAYSRGEDGVLHAMADWDGEGMFAMQMVGHAAIAIANWVFDDLIEKKIAFPWWRCEYKDWDWFMPSEDMYFGKCCERAGITMWVDTMTETPHLIANLVDRDTWRRYMADHPEMLNPKAQTVKVGALSLEETSRGEGSG